MLDYVTYYCVKFFCFTILRTFSTYLWFPWKSYDLFYPLKTYFGENPERLSKAVETRQGKLPCEISLLEGLGFYHTLEVLQQMVVALGPDVQCIGATGAVQISLPQGWGKGTTDHMGLCPEGGRTGVEGCVSYARKSQSS